ncbi:glycosyl hydrolase family 20, catalytic domain-containing protein [Phthorimaea operculella]|nr:glycosyl hydrolase family 20, catalytic domain-containing protein [Phthorimaea operculella]
MKHIANKYKENEELPAEDVSGCQSENSLPQEEPSSLLGRIQTLRVNLLAPCEDYPYLEMDESYTLSVTISATLSSASVWESCRARNLLKLFYFTDDFSEIRINATEVSDAPAYKHRGLLLDTSRHYIPVQDILLTIEALAINKMNVFHWHIVDDQSFPYQSEKFPNLSAQGAYDESMVYTKADIQSIVNYATERGVRVIPEFDVPGHTSSWGAAYPNLLTECYSNGRVTNLGPMNPIRNTTYELIRDLIQEVQGIFPDHYIHIGGDEVKPQCWESNPEIREWMAENKLSTSMLYSYFMSRTLPLVQPKSEAIVWQVILLLLLPNNIFCTESSLFSCISLFLPDCLRMFEFRCLQEVFDNKVELTNATLIHFWKGWGHPEWKMQEALREGFRILFSSYWYLDYLRQSFEMMLMLDPREVAAVNSQTCTYRTSTGGRPACGERVWPRACAVAERLWSGPPVDTSEQTMRRIEEHTCRMKRRGVPAAPPSGPGFCLL